MPWTDVYDDLYRVNGLISQIKNDETRHFFEAALEESIRLKDWKFDVEKYNAVRANSYPICEQRIIDAIVTYFEAKRICEPQPISIFVSYAYDNNAHKEKVESFVNMLRGNMGFNAQMDSSLKNQYPDIDMP